MFLAAVPIFSAIAFEPTPPPVRDTPVLYIEEFPVHAKILYI
jgi:hypothetical protein